MQRETEERLISRARRGDGDAFLQLFDDNRLPLFRFAYRLTNSIADAEDVLQECFLGLLRPDNHFDSRRTSLRTYLFGAVRNQAFKRLRERNGTAEQVERPSEGRQPERHGLRVDVARAVHSLPETQREVLILAHYEQLPLSEIAEILEIEVAAVKSRLQRARNTLREALAPYAPAIDAGFVKERKP